MTRLGGDRFRNHVDEARNPLFQAVPLVIALAAALTLVLAAIAALHAYWGFGGIWPGRDAADCARRIAGFRDIRAMPGPAASFAVAGLLALVVGLSLAPAAQA